MVVWVTTLSGYTCSDSAMTAFKAPVVFLVKAELLLDDILCQHLLLS